MRFNPVLLTVAAVISGSTFVSAVFADDLPPAPSISMVRKLSPVYPLDALLKGRTGWAEVRFMVDYSGRAVMTCVLSASSPAFGHSLLADVEADEFIPPRVNGQPQLTLSGQRFIFEGEGKLEPNEKRVLAELRLPIPTVVSAKDLDKPLTSIRQEPPVYPYALESDGLSGHAEIEFIVDHDGHAIFPRIISSTQEDFGWSAATAIARWRYQPPVKGGQKVDARTTVTVNFDHNKGSATW
jgi:TonB family protein